MPPRRRSALRWSAVVLILGFYIAGAVWFAGHTPIYRLYRSAGGARVSYEKARVLTVKDEELERENGSGLDTGYQDLEVRILTGEKKGAEFEIRNFLNYTTNIRLGPGSAIIVHMDVADAEHYTVSVYSLDRGPALLALAVIFFAALCGIGGRRGARSVLGIGFTFASIAFLFIPLLYRGFSPTLSAVAVVAATVGVLSSSSAASARRPCRPYSAPTRVSPSRPSPSSLSRGSRLYPAIRRPRPTLCWPSVGKAE